MKRGLTAVLTAAAVAICALIPSSPIAMLASAADTTRLTQNVGVGAITDTDWTVKCNPYDRQSDNEIPYIEYNTFQTIGGGSPQAIRANSTYWMGDDFQITFNYSRGATFTETSYGYFQLGRLGLCIADIRDAETNTASSNISIRADYDAHNITKEVPGGTVIASADVGTIDLYETKRHNYIVRFKDNKISVYCDWKAVAGLTNVDVSQYNFSFDDVYMTAKIYKPWCTTMKFSGFTASLYMTMDDYKDLVNSLMVGNSLTANYDKVKLANTMYNSLTDAQKATVNVAKLNAAYALAYPANPADGPAPAAAPVVGRAIGDINGDGVVNTADVDILTAKLNRTGTIGKFSIVYADIDMNGVVNAADKTALEQMIADGATPQLLVDRTITTNGVGDITASIARFGDSGNQSRYVQKSLSQFVINGENTYILHKDEILYLASDDVTTTGNGSVKEEFFIRHDNPSHSQHSGIIPVSKLHDKIFCSMNLPNSLASIYDCPNAYNMEPVAAVHKRANAIAALAVAEGETLDDDDTFTICISDMNMLFCTRSQGWIVAQKENMPRYASTFYGLPWKTLPNKTYYYDLNWIDQNLVNRNNPDHIEVTVTGADFNAHRVHEKVNLDPQFVACTLHFFNSGVALPEYSDFIGIADSYRIWIKEAEFSNKITASIGADIYATYVDENGKVQGPAAEDLQLFNSRAVGITNVPQTIVGHSFGSEIYDQYLGNNPTVNNYLDGTTTVAEFLNVN